MSELVVTFKADGAPWVVIHADTPDDYEQLLAEFKQRMNETIEVAKQFRDTGAAAFPPRSNGAPRGGGGYGSRQQAAPSGPTVELKVPFDRADVRAAVKNAGAKWNGTNKTWVLEQSKAEPFEEFVQ